MFPRGVVMLTSGDLSVEINADVYAWFLFRDEASFKMPLATFLARSVEKESE